MDDARLSPQLLLRPRGLGTFLGVFVPCTCTIFGVVVFLRLGFVVGQAGLYCALLIVLASYAICLLTTLSLCALIADGDDRHRRGSVSDTGSPAKDPGVYAALRQAVGTPLGGALGLAFYLAFTVDVAFYIIGFAEMFSRAADVSSSIQIFPWNPPGSWVDTAVASAALALLALVCACGVHVSARVSLLTLCVICACILASLACLLFPTDDALSGHTQFSLTTLANNSAPALEDFDGRGLSLMKMFTLTFPGFTGVLAGSNLSANLRTPTRSIAAGTLASLLFVLVTYAAICFVLAASVDRPVLKDPRVMIMDTAVATITGLPLGYVGVVCTTLSSALSYLLGAPRVLHAVVRDAPWPPLQRLLATDRSAAAAEPLRALALTWALVQLIVLSGTLDLLSPLVSGVFLLAFTLINLVAFVAAASRRRAFAPTFKYHSRATALIGFVLSFLAMVVSLSDAPAVAAALCALLVLLLWWRRRELYTLLTSGEWAGRDALRSERERREALNGGGAMVDSPDLGSAELEERLQCAAACVHDGLRGRFRGGLYELTAAKNAEMRLRWQRVCILHKMDSIVPHVVEFIKEQGRMKFVRPLYRDLYLWEAQRDVAVQTFLEWKSNYHPICAKMLAQDLKLAE